MIIDKQGRIAGKVSLIDIVLFIVAAGIIIGFGYRRMSTVATTIVNTNTRFYVTLNVEPVRDFSINAVKDGDIFYKQHEQQPLGTVVYIRKENAKEIIKQPDGTIDYVEMQDKYALYITLECTGNVNDGGFYVNGSSPISAGSDVTVQSNKVLCGARVESVSIELGG